MSETNTTVQTIEPLLNKYGFTKISNTQDLKKFFDIDILDDDSCPIITTTKKTILVFDNSKFNETYLIDEINKYFDTLESDKIESFDKIYVDEPLVRRDIFANQIMEEDFQTIENLERDFLLPTIMLINPESNEFTYFQETIVGFDLESIKTIMTWLID